MSDLLPLRGPLGRSLGALLAITWAGAACQPAPPAAPERILLVSIDTLRADHVGVYGARRAATPVVDGLATAGVRFEAALAPTPLTLPSHASLMTGLDPTRHGVHHNALFQLEPGFPTLAERLREAGYATAAFVGSYALDRKFGLARGFDHYDDRMVLGESGVGAVRIAERRADAVVDATLEWLGQAPDRFFLFVHFYDPHAEYHPPAAYAARFPGDPYSAEVAFVDAQIGRLFQVLTTRYRSGNLAVVTSDHGESLGEHREPTHSYGIYDSTQRVPLLMAGPGLPRGRVVPELVRLVDVAPTLLELAGLPPFPEATGRSLLPLLAGREREPRSAYLETLATHYDMGWSPLFGLRTGFEKYVRAPRPELYDLGEDPGETRNLAEERPERVAALDRQLDALLPPLAVARPNLSLADDERAQLESLGYVAPEASGATAARLGEVGGTDPKDAMGLIADMHRANSLIAAGRPARALALLEKLRDAGTAAQALRFKAALQLGRLDVMKQAARTSIEKAPASFEGHVLMGMAFEAEGRLDDAEAEYALVERLNPGSGTPLTARGRLMEARGEPERAAELYHRAREARIPDPEASIRLAAQALQAGGREEAEALLSTLTEAQRNEPGAALHLAAAEHAAGLPDAALARLEAARRHHPRDRRLLLNHATQLEQAGQLEEALAAREAALEVNPDDPVIQNDVAWTLAQLGRNLDRALALAETALERTGPHPPVLDTVATVRLARGEPERALARIEEALPTATGADREHLLQLRTEARARLADPAE